MKELQRGCLEAARSFHAVHHHLELLTWVKTYRQWYLFRRDKKIGIRGIRTCGVWLEGSGRERERGQKRAWHMYAVFQTLDLLPYAITKRSNSRIAALHQIPSIPTQRGNGVMSSSN